MIGHDRGWDDEVDAWVARPRRRPTDEPDGRCGACARVLPIRALRREPRRRTWVCLDCLAVRDRPVAERAVALAAEALAWPGGRVSLVVGPYCDDPSVPLARWPIVLLLERYRCDRKVDGVALADCRDLVDRFATMALVNRALGAPRWDAPPGADGPRGL
jgi:hypothetical protein